MANVIEKEFDFSYAHILPNHKGKCRNLHGHNCKLIVGVSGSITTQDALPEYGMVEDFSTIKGIVKSLVVDVLDHKFLAQGDEWPLDVIRLVDGLKQMFNEVDLPSRHELKLSQIADRILSQNIPTQIVLVGVPTTAEMMAALTFDILHRTLSRMGVRMEYVKWWETPTSMAYCDEDGWSSSSVRIILEQSRPHWFVRDIELWQGVNLGSLR